MCCAYRLLASRYDCQTSIHVSSMTTWCSQTVTSALRHLLSDQVGKMFPCLRSWKDANAPLVILVFIKE